MTIDVSKDASFHGESAACDDTTTNGTAIHHIDDSDLAAFLREPA